MKKEKITYRRAGIDDIPVMIDLRVRCLNEVYNHPEDHETETVKASLLQYFSKEIASGNFVAWLAEYDGQIIGTSGMVVWQIPARYEGVETGKLGYLLNSYTVPEARRKGICSRLLDELIKEAHLLGLRYLHLHASRDGMNIYRKAGFTEPAQPELELNLKQREFSKLIHNSHE